MALSLHLQNIPARNGLLWIRHGFKVYQRAPLALSGLFAAFMFIASLLMLLPGPLRVLSIMILPLVSLGFMLATHLVLQDKRPTFSVFLAPLKLTPQRRTAQLVLCGSYALLTLLLMWLADVLDGGAVATAMEQFAAANGDEAMQLAAMQNPALLSGMLLRMAIFALLSVPYWHAPALVHWGGQGALQALFSSTLGIWRNKGAFSLNALGWAAWLLGVSLLLTLLMSALGMNQVMPFAALLISWVFSTVFYASLYFTFVDCFMFGAPKDLPGQTM